MPCRLEDECLDAVGSKVLVSPIFGWGWSDDQPSDFRGVLEQLVADPQGDLRGGYVVIDEPGHKYDGCFCIFSLRYKGIWNFRSQLGDYVACIYRELPSELPDLVIDFRPSTLPPGYSTCGYAVIGVPEARAEFTRL